MSRYRQLQLIIKTCWPRSIVEIGTWNGVRAVEMIRKAQQYRKNIQYVGYDLFEDANDGTDVAELNVKQHHAVADVEAYIRANCPDADVHLIKGNTRATLNAIAADLCFIDGGHSLETIANDYDKCKSSAVIVLDDYYSADESGAMPDTALYGCNALVDSLPGAFLLPIKNAVRPGGYTQMAMTLGRKGKEGEGVTTVCCSGGFDPLHLGHLRYLQAASKYGSVTVILNSDAWLLRKKGYIFMSYEERREILLGLECVDEVMSVDDADGTVCRALMQRRPHFFANGGDRGPGNTPEQETCGHLGIEMLWGVGGDDKIQASSRLVEQAIQQKLLGAGIVRGA